MSNTIEKPFTTIDMSVSMTEIDRLIDGIKISFQNRKTTNMHLPGGVIVAGFIMEYALLPEERKFNIYFAHHLISVNY